jgi:hypothetical protein
MVAVLAGGWLAEGWLGQAWAQPPRLPVTVTVEAGFVSRDIIVQELISGVLVEDTTIADSSRLLVTVAVTPVAPLTLYLLGGGASLNLDEFGYNGNLNGMYGGGLTVTVYESASRAPGLPGLSLFIDARLLRFVTDDVVLVTAGGPPVSTTEEITWDESRVRFGAKGGYYGFQPYGGIELSWIRGKDRLEGFGSFNIREEDNIGLFGGLLFPLDPEGRLGFFVEVNIIDEYALRGGVVFAL